VKEQLVLPFLKQDSGYEEREADRSPPSSVEFKNAWSYPPVRLHDAVLN